MMKNTIIYIGLLLLMSLSFHSCDKMDISSEQANSFIKLYGDWSSDIGTDVKIFNNGYLLLATTTNVDSMNTDITIIQTDRYGNQKGKVITIDGGANDMAGNLLITNDGGFVVVGTYEDTTNIINPGQNQYYNQDIYLAKYTSSAELEWEKFIGSTNTLEQGTVVRKSPDGYIIAGNTDRDDDVTENPLGTKDVYVVKVDDQGNLEWDRNYGADQTDYASDIIVRYDGYLIIGSSNSFSENGQGLFDILLIKTSFSGIGVHKYTYGSIYNDYGHAVIETSEGYVFTGSVENINGNNADVYVAMVDKEDLLDIIWNESFGSTLYDQGFDIMEKYSGFTIVGNFEVSNGTTAAYFLQTDYEGNKLKENIIGNYDETIYSVEPTADGGYVMIGSSGQVGNEMICLIKVDAEGEL